MTRVLMTCSNCNGTGLVENALRRKVPCLRCDGTGTSMQEHPATLPPDYPPVSQAEIDEIHRLGIENPLSESQSRRLLQKCCKALTDSEEEQEELFARVWEARSKHPFGEPVEGES